MLRFLVVLALCLATSAQAPESRKLVLILLGPPAAGKTTQARYLSRKHRIPFINAADLLKREVGRKTPLGRSLKVALESGELVSDQQMNELFQARMRRKDALNGFILDGYPRTAAQARFLDAFLDEHRLPQPIVIQLQVPDRVAVQRSRSRGRADDIPAVIERRLSDYHRDAEAVFAHYGRSVVIEVDGSKPEKEVSFEIDRQLASRLR